MHAPVAQGGDLRQALSSDVDGALGWYLRGHRVALDIARGLHFLHARDVRTSWPPLGLFPEAPSCGRRDVSTLELPAPHSSAWTESEGTRQSTVSP